MCFRIGGKGNVVHEFIDFVSPPDNICGTFCTLETDQRMEKFFIPNPIKGFAVQMHATLHRLISLPVDQRASVIRHTATSQLRVAFGSDSSDVIRTWRSGTSRGALSPRPSLWSSPASPGDPVIARNHSSFQRRIAFWTSGFSSSAGQLFSAALFYGWVSFYESESK